MPRVKNASKRTRLPKAALPGLGAGLALSLVGSASASTTPMANVPQTTNFNPNDAIALGEEEIADVSLATFHIFDRETAGKAVQLAYRGCGGCRGCRGCRGCAGCRACRCGGCGGCGGCCASWGSCRWC